jgi:hypothetical protein
MYRAIPTGNKLLAQKWADRDQEIHLRKLREMKPSVVTFQMKKHRNHLNKKAKKEQLLEGHILFQNSLFYISFTKRIFR